ncbi:MAG: FAD-binding oxidoreductase [Nanoarchaeota archaeon]
MAQEHLLKILKVQQVTSSVKRFHLEKPSKFKFIPGHSVMIALPENKEDSHPFSFTSTNDEPYLEFHIKKYNNPNNFTQSLHTLSLGDSLILADVFGSIRYTKLGLMIAGGQAITPFIAILRQLKKENALIGNTLIHTVKTRSDLYLQEELKSLLGDNYIVTITQEQHLSYLHGRITKELLKQHLPLNKQCYVLGSDEFVSQVKSMLKTLQ